eukprot:IDg5883t1
MGRMQMAVCCLPVCRMRARKQERHLRVFSLFDDASIFECVRDEMRQGAKLACAAVKLLRSECLHFASEPGVAVITSGIGAPGPVNWAEKDRMRIQGQPRCTAETHDCVKQQLLMLYSHFV